MMTASNGAESASSAAPEEKKLRLYLQQKALLEQFLANGAITKAQYDKSLGDLTVKMGMEGYKDL